MVIVAAVAVMCKSAQDITAPSAKMMQPENVGSYHNPVAMTIAWFPYESMKLERTSDNNWTVVDSDTTNGFGAVPVIMIDSVEWSIFQVTQSLSGHLLRTAIQIL